MTDFIPLLSPKPLVAFTPEEFKSYVIGLYFKPEPKRKAQKDFKVSARILKSGIISLTTKRNPKYITVSEISSIGEDLFRLDSEVKLAAESKGFIVRDGHEENS